MKRPFTFRVLPVLIILLAGSVILLQKQKTDREKYEDFILESFAPFEDLDITTDENSKSPDQPDMAAYQEYLTTVDPELGYVPKKRLWEAYHYTRSLSSEQKSTREYEPPIEWMETGANMGGRTRALMFDPNDPNNRKVWAGGVTGGLWYNNNITDAGINWIPVGDFWSNLAISCITYDPNDTETFYVGTGEAQTARIIYRESSGVGAGIFKTTDGGETWEQMSSTSDFEYITDIVVRDEDGKSVIYAAVASGTYMGVDHESQPADGLFRSDDGTSWEQVLPLIPGFTDEPFTPADIEIASNGRIYVGTMENLNGLGGATVLFSDTGMEDSWTVYDYYNSKIGNENYFNIPARTIVASAPSNPNVVYAQFAPGYVNGFTYYRGRYMAKSVDGGDTWTQINRPDDDWSTLAWHAFILKVDPDNENVIYTGGLDLWKSQTAGQTWNHISDWSLMYWGGGDEYVHADQHNIQFQPGTPTRSLFSSDGGVFMTNTANQTLPVFMERNQGYNTLQFYSCAINPTPGSNRYIGGLQDNGTLFYNNSPLDINDMIDGGDGAFCFWDQNDSYVFITSVYYNRYTFWYNYNDVSYVSETSGTFISPADYNYRDNILYSNGVTFGGGNQNTVLRVSNIPSNINEQLVNLGTSSTVPFSHIKYSRFSPIGTSTIFAGTQSGKLYKVTNAQSVPIPEEIGSPDFPTANISCVAVGNNEDVLLVTFSNYGVSSLWLTKDGGETWEEKEANLPDMPVRWAIFHPNNNGQALLATETGVWATNTLYEDETVWAPANDGMANVRVDMLKIRHADDVVLAASHGRGLFTTTYELDIYVGEAENTSPSTEIAVYPNPTSDWLKVSADLGQAQSVIISITDLNGKKVFEKETNSSAMLNEQIDVSGLSTGFYLLNLNYKGVVESKKFLVQ
jgi:photosystem II stability/assembly factor-like uncharacterized protein